MLEEIGLLDYMIVCMGICMHSLLKARSRLEIMNTVNKIQIKQCSFLSYRVLCNQMKCMKYS